MSYSVNVADDDQRTMSVDDIVRAYKAGEINGETYVWEDGMEDWLPIANVPVIMKAVNDAAGLPAAGGGVRAARREPSRGAIDLFGGGDEPPPSEGDGGDEPHFTGQRNKQSVLFSLNALGGSPAPKAPGSGPTGSSSSSSNKAKTNEDSGLIDLGALAKAAEASSSSSQQQMAMAPPIQLGSILGPSVLEAPSAPATVAPPAAQKNNTPIYVVGALITAAILGVGAMFALKSDPKPDPAAATPTVTATATTTATADTTAAATAPASSASDPTATPTASSGAGGAKPATPSGAGGKGAAPSGAGGKGAATAAPTPTPTATTPPKPTGGPCGCAPGDLSCAIACKAKK